MHCFAHQSTTPVEVALHHAPDDLPAFGAVTRIHSPYGGPYDGEVIGFHREYGVTNVSVVLHTDICPVRCIATRVRLSELDVVPAATSVIATRDGGYA